MDVTWQKPKKEGKKEKKKKTMRMNTVPTKSFLMADIFQSSFYFPFKTLLLAKSCCILQSFIFCPLICHIMLDK